jgi:hypothetical protein
MRRLSAAPALVTSAVMLFVTTLTAQGGPPQPSPTDSSALRGFVVTLVLGDTQAGASGTFTPAATKALTDLKDFLPYKAYRPLDTAWIIGLPGPHLQLNGVEDGRKHEFFMSAALESPRVATVRLLRLWDARAPDAPNPPPPAVLIDTSFKIDLGETVAVGTSRLSQGRALILLVTAVAR